MEVLLEIVFEVVFQLFFEFLGAALDGTFELSEKTTKWLLKSAFFLGLGWVLGWVSFLVVPHTLTGGPLDPFFSLGAIPLMAAGCATGLAKWLDSRFDFDTGIRKFGYSFLFAWVFAATRYRFLLGV